MPAYDYRCQTCDKVFEQRTSIHAADDVICPDGHTDVKRLLSVFAVAGRAASAPSPGAAPSGGGCCGGGCGCG